MSRRRDIVPAATSSITSTALIVPKLGPSLEQASNRGIARTTTVVSSSTPSATSTSPYVEYRPSDSATSGQYFDDADETFTSGAGIEQSTSLTPFLQQSFPEISLDRSSMAGLPSDPQQESIPDKEDLNLPPHKVFLSYC